MGIASPFNLSKPLVGEASVDLQHPAEQVFAFVGENFFGNYPKWALEVSDFQPLDGEKVFVGAKAKQMRSDNGNAVESVFEIAEYQPGQTLVVQGLNAPYRQTYLIESSPDPHPTRLTFRFELTSLEIFMRPFEKLIRYAIEEGAENTVNNIRDLLCAQCAN